MGPYHNTPISLFFFQNNLSQVIVFKLTMEVKGSFPSRLLEAVSTQSALLALLYLSADLMGDVQIK